VTDLLDLLSAQEWGRSEFGWLSIDEDDRCYDCGSDVPQSGPTSRWWHGTAEDGVEDVRLCRGCAQLVDCRRRPDAAACGNHFGFFHGRVECEGLHDERSRRRLETHKRRLLGG